MQRLTLVRHAKSSWKHPELADYERPLNKRGHRDLPHAAARCQANIPAPDRIVASGAVRTWITATAFHHHFGLSVPLYQDDRLYHATVPEIITLLMEQYEPHILLVGHNPGLAMLVEFLCGDVLEKLPTCAILHLHLNINHWSALQRGCGIINYFDYPKRHTSSTSTV